jgi:hypothetical protein
MLARVKNDGQQVCHNRDEAVRENIVDTFNIIYGTGGKCAELVFYRNVSGVNPALFYKPPHEGLLPRAGRAR